MRERIATLAGVLAAGTLLSASFLPFHGVEAAPKPCAHGEELFATRGCVHCHGPAGVGGTIGPDLQLIRKRMNAEAMARQIRNGGMAMPAFGNQLSEGEISDLVAYLRTKRKIVPVPAAPPASEVKPVAKDPD